ncbi:MAG: squalene synthase HpnC [Acidimicrobiales bacterium]
MSSKLTQTISSFLNGNDNVTARARHENFPVASRLLPRTERDQLMAIYAFARLTDDIGDEATGDRLALLDWLDDELDLAFHGGAIHPVFQRLTPVIKGLDLSPEPFRQLIEANRIDQSVTRYQSFEDLVGYCMLSAAPVGRLVLAVFDASTPNRRERSDQICIALQVVEHLQDVGEDARAGRIYLPLDDLARFGCEEGDLLADAANGPLREVVAFESERARALLVEGAPLAATLAWRARFAVEGFVAGGLSVLDALQDADCDVLAIHCRPTKRALASHMASAFFAKYRSDA